MDTSSNPAASPALKPQAHLWLGDAHHSDALRALLLNLNVLPTSHAVDGNALPRIAQAIAGPGLCVAVIELDAAAALGKTLLNLANTLPKAQLGRVFLVQRKDTYVLPAMRDWARAMGFADLLPQLSPPVLLGHGSAIPAPDAKPRRSAPAAVPALAMAAALGIELSQARAEQFLRAMGVAQTGADPRQRIRQHTKLEAETLAQEWAGAVRSVNHSYHLKSYPACFVGTEAVGWLNERFALGERDAIAVGQAMVSLGLIHHVAQEHDFENKAYFYRGAVSGLVDRVHLDATLATLTGKTGVSIADRVYGTTSYPQCFVGSQAVDVITQHYKLARHDALNLLDRLHAMGLIEHVTQEHRMRDGNFYYRLMFS